MPDTGDLRVWKAKYDRALEHIRTGDIQEARKILSSLATDAPYDEIRKDAARHLARFDHDWVAYVIFGGTALVLLAIVIKYVF
jgi:predicted Zn-dependent protease